MSELLANFLSPPILFFFLGGLTVLVRSDLEIPPSTARFLSLYLLFSIGFRGGAELRHTGLGGEALDALGAAILLAVVQPVVAFFLLRKRLGTANAAALAAVYGSVSAVTFITASAYLQQRAVPYGGYMVAAMALMESPAIIIGVFLARRFSGHGEPGAVRTGSVRHLLRESFTNGSVLLITGSLLIGYLSSPIEAADVRHFTDFIFKGFLCFFLLEMGMLAFRRVDAIRKAGWVPFAFAIVMPLVGATSALFLARGLGLGHGDSLLLMVLGASASYIAVPAALRISLPEADPGLYVPMALALTFPFNILIGIPLYNYVLHTL